MATTRKCARPGCKRKACTGGKFCWQHKRKVGKCGRSSPKKTKKRTASTGPARRPKSKHVFAKKKKLSVTPVSTMQKAVTQIAAMQNGAITIANPNISGVVSINAVMQLRKITGPSNKGEQFCRSYKCSYSTNVVSGIPGKMYSTLVELYNHIGFYVPNEKTVENPCTYLKQFHPNDEWIGYNCENINPYVKELYLKFVQYQGTHLFEVPRFNEKELQKIAESTQRFEKSPTDFYGWSFIDIPDSTDEDDIPLMLIAKPEAMLRFYLNVNDTIEKSGTQPGILIRIKIPKGFKHVAPLDCIKVASEIRYGDYHFDQAFLVTKGTIRFDLDSLRVRNFGIRRSHQETGGCNFFDILSMNAAMSD